MGKKEAKPKMVDNEILEIFRKGLEGAGFSKSDVNKIVTISTDTGFFKKGLLGIRPYKGNIILFMKDDGKIEIKEEAESGILTVTDKDGDSNKHIIDPKKIYTLENPFGDDYKCWVLYEGEAFCYPSDVVYDATVFNNIMIQYEANRIDEELRSKAMNIKMIGMIIFGALIIMALLFSNWNYIMQLLGMGGSNAQNIVTAG